MALRLTITALQTIPVLSSLHGHYGVFYMLDAIDATKVARIVVQLAGDVTTIGFATPAEQPLGTLVTDLFPEAIRVEEIV